MNNSLTNKVRQTLIDNKDKEYKEFIASLSPSEQKDFFIGVRVPKIREISKSLSKEEKEVYLHSLPHLYREENLLHGYLLSEQKDFDKVIKEVEDFLPYVTTWEISDTMAPKIFKKNTKELFPYILKWLKTDKVYTLRFAIDCLMNFYLDDDFCKSHLELVKNVHNDDYYVKMMQAWYYATALNKQYESTIELIKSNVLPKWIHNKTISKAIESSRIDKITKEYLKSLKRA